MRVVGRFRGNPKTRLVWLAAIVALATAAEIGVAGVAGGATPRAPLGAPAFISSCGFSHRSGDDPIVYPGRPGVSHDHTFVGNVSTKASSTLSSLHQAATTCARAADTAAYWAPTLFVDGRPVQPVGATIYYRRLTTSPVRPFPPGLRMIAGDSHAWKPQPLRVTFWDCQLIKTRFYGPAAREPDLRPAPGPVSSTASSTVPRCAANTFLQLHVNFPDCWNGRSLDSSNHRSQMAYSVRGACGRRHPVAVPAVSLVMRYAPVTDDLVALASGGQYSGHADFINSWQQGALSSLVTSCLNERHACTDGT